MTKNTSKHSGILDRDMKQGILKYEAGILTTQLRNSVRRLLVTNEANEKVNCRKVHIITQMSDAPIWTAELNLSLAASKRTWDARIFRCLHCTLRPPQISPENLISPHPVKKLLAFYGTRRHICGSQQPSSCPYPETDESNTRPSISLSKIHFNIGDIGEHLYPINVSKGVKVLPLRADRLIYSSARSKYYTRNLLTYIHGCLH